MIGALEVDAVRELELVLAVRLAVPVEAPTARRESELGFLASILGVPEAMDLRSPRRTPRQSWYDENRPAGAPSGRRLCSNYGAGPRPAAPLPVSSIPTPPPNHGRTAGPANGRRPATPATR